MILRMTAAQRGRVTGVLAPGNRDQGRLVAFNLAMAGA